MLAGSQPQILYSFVRIACTTLCSDLVQLSVLVPQVLQEDGGIEWRAGHRLHQLVAGRVQAADLVDPLVQPQPQAVKLAGCNVLLQPRQLLLGRLPKNASNKSLVETPPMQGV